MRVGAAGCFGAGLDGTGDLGAGLDGLGDGLGDGEPLHVPRESRMAVLSPGSGRGASNRAATQGGSSSRQGSSSEGSSRVVGFRVPTQAAHPTHEGQAVAAMVFCTPPLGHLVQRLEPTSLA